MKSKTITNIYLLMAAAFLTVAFALPAAAQQVKMTVSGTAANSSIDTLLQTNSTNTEYDLTGTSALGSFTFRLINAEPNSPPPMPPSTCSGVNQLYLPVSTGAGVFRFQDGSLLVVQLTGGSDCIDFSAGQALCIRSLLITSGTGRFKNAGGTLTLTETVVPLLADTTSLPVFFAVTGGITGTISGVDQSQGLQW